MIARNLGGEKAKFESEPHDSKAGTQILILFRHKIVPAQITQKCQNNKLRRSAKLLNYPEVPSAVFRHCAQF
jgi:hypothetical protein